MLLGNTDPLVGYYFLDKVQCVTNICICIRIREYQAEYSYLSSPFFVNPNIFVFVFALFIQTEYICIHIRPFLSTQIYSYLYSPFLFKPNIFVFVFALFCQPKYICIHICPKNIKSNNFFSSFFLFLL